MNRARVVLAAAALFGAMAALSLEDQCALVAGQGSARHDAGQLPGAAAVASDWQAVGEDALGEELIQ